MKKTKPIECVPATKISTLTKQIDKILMTLGHSEALVTDESCVGDFDPSPPTIKKLQKLYPKAGQKTPLVTIALYMARL